MKRIQSLGVALLIAFVINNVAQAGIVADFSLSEWAVDELGNVTCDPAGPFTATDEIASDVDSAVITTYGFPVGGGGNYAGELNYSSWNQLANNDRLAIEITLADGLQIDLTRLTLNIVRNGAAAPTDLNVSLAADDVVIDSISGIAIRSGTAGALLATGYEHTFDLSSAANQSGTFTLWVKTPNGRKVGNFRINNIVVEGDILTIPEPCTLGFLTLGVGGLLTRKR